MRRILSAVAKAAVALLAIWHAGTVAVDWLGRLDFVVQHAGWVAVIGAGMHWVWNAPAWVAPAGLIIFGVWWRADKWREHRTVLRSADATPFLRATAPTPVAVAPCLPVPTQTAQPTLSGQVSESTKEEWRRLEPLVMAFAARCKAKEGMSLGEFIRLANANVDYTALLPDLGEGYRSRMYQHGHRPEEWREPALFEIDALIGQLIRIRRIARGLDNAP
jgi:hypothetical protein